MKKILIIIIAYIVIKLFYKHTYKIPKCDADIIISPCGLKGTYTMGICHYLKNNFDLSDKKILGFSSGSFNNLFMSLHNEKNNEFLKKLMKNKLNNDIKGYLKKTIDCIGENFSDEDFNLNRLNVAVTHTNESHIYNNFLNLKDALDCCTSSSFIPFLTYKDVFYFYKYRLCLDGAVCYKAYNKNNDRALIISHYMFKRYKKPRIPFHGMYSKYANLYQMYLYGYNDARNNHDYFLKYLKPL